MNLAWLRIAVLLFVVRDIPAQEFDVASIRESVAPMGPEVSRKERVDVSPTGVWVRNGSLKFAIEWAYGLKFYRVTGPGWLNGTRYDIQAKTQEPHPPLKDLQLMMRNLLAARFKVVAHKEMQSKPVYVLERGKGSLKLEPSEIDDRLSFRVEEGDFVFGATTMSEFAERLSDFATVDRPVVDKTGLTGAFDCRLVSAASAIRGGDGPSIFTAVAEIGLRLRPSNEPIEILVVDSAEKKPTSN